MIMKKQKPQDWLMVASDESITSVVSKGKTYFIKISPEDFKLVGKYRWYLTQNGYAITWSNGKRLRMHHLVLGKPPEGKEVDHINRNRLDNRRVNLRFVTSLQNGQNTTAVGVRKHGKLWEAYICLNYKKYSKSFRTLTSAKKWRQQMKEKYINSLNQ